MPVLHYEAGEGAGRKVEFGDSVVLGRLRTAQVPIPDPEASREHTRVVREAGGWFVVDCGSRNGTEVNGLKVTRQALKTGDRIRIAKTVLRFEEEAGAAPPAVPPIPLVAPPVPSGAPRPSGRIAPPAVAAGGRPSGAQAAPAARPTPVPPGPARHHGPTGPSGAAQMAVYALLAALFVGLLFLSRWIASVAIDRMVQNQRQEQPK